MYAFELFDLNQLNSVALVVEFSLFHLVKQMS